MITNVQPSIRMEGVGGGDLFEKSRFLDSEDGYSKRLLTTSNAYTIS